MQLAKEIGITQKSAWFVLHRLREACGGRDLTKLAGIIEIDETFIGGLEKNKHEHKKLHAGRGPVGKTAVIGMRSRSGRVVAMPISGVDLETVQGKIHQHVEKGSTLHTDEGRAYNGIGSRGFKHETVNHGEAEYVRGDVTTNGIESVFAVMKRGLIGVYHHASPKHLGRYVDEFSFRLNEGNVKNHTLTRLDSFVDGVAGKRLTYKWLIQ
jgi:transposase-like protein